MIITKVILTLDIYIENNRISYKHHVFVCKNRLDSIINKTKWFITNLFILKIMGENLSKIKFNFDFNYPVEFTALMITKCEN